MKADELNVLRVQIQSAKKKEQAEKQRLEQLRLDAIQKEENLNKILDEKKQEYDRLQLEFASLKRKDEDAQKREEILKNLKNETDRLRDESVKAAQTARTIIQQREVEYRKKEEEMIRIREESEKKARAIEEKALELARQKDEERKQKEAELVKIKEETERLRQQHEEKAREVIE